MPELSVKEKTSHKEVKYERVSSHAGKSCGNCEHVIEAISGVRCQTVKDPIYLTGYCIRWEKK